MKVRLFLGFFLFVFLVATSLFAMPAVVEGESKIPYDSLGELQVKTRTHPSLWQRIINLGQAPDPTSDEIAHKLLAQLSTKSARYGANAVIHVQFWPEDLKDASRMAQDYVYAKAEMIRYKKFAETPPQENPPG